MPVILFYFITEIEVLKHFLDGCEQHFRPVTDFKNEQDKLVNKKKPVGCTHIESVG